MREFHGTELEVFPVMKWGALLLSVLAIFTRPAYADGVFDVDAVARIASSAKNLDAAIGELPPELFKAGNFVIAYESRSQQKGLGPTPRVIVFTPDVKTIIAWNGGNPKQPYHDVFEVIQWREATKTFEFRILPSAEKPNPQRCTDCHTTAYRPNWDSYPLWPGFFAYEHQVYAPAREKTLWKQFRALQPEHARYKRLELPPQGDDDRPSLILDRGLSRLTFGLSRLNFQRIARELKETKGIAAVKYALLGAVGGCEKFEEFFPKPLQAAIRTELATRMKTLKADFAREHRQKILRHIGDEKAPDDVFTKGRQDEWNLPYLAGIGVTLSRIGAEPQMKNWSLARYEKVTSFNNGVGTTAWFRNRLFSDPSASHHQGFFAALIDELGYDDVDPYVEVSRRTVQHEDRLITMREVRPNCDGLKTKSTAALEAPPSR